MRAKPEARRCVNDRFFFEYGAAAERAGLYDKAAELFKRAIELDPADAAPGLQLSRLHVGRPKHPP